uniref:PDZ domain-containing protein n=1 Tax=Schlesneria paludicola TaxID=360056 RepID=A0A7C4QLU5_9PLAN
MKILWTAIFAGVFLPCATAGEDPKPPRQVPGIEVELQLPPPPDSDVLIATASPVTQQIVGVQMLSPLFMTYGGAGTETGSHWIGLGCSAANEALRAQLGLGDAGVVVHDVVDKGPAQSAGVQKYDVFTKAIVGDQEFVLKDTPDLANAVKAANLKPLKLVGLRGGKPIDVEVTPAERPPQAVISVFAGPGLFPPHQLGIDVERIKQLLEENRIEELKEYVNKRAQEVPQPWGLSVAGPIVTPPPMTIRDPLADLPENVTVTITRTGKEPAQIQVKMGEKSWSVNEHELDKLPENVRGYVEGLLQRTITRSWKARMTRTFAGQPKGSSGGAPATPAAPFSQSLVPAFPVKPPSGDVASELKQRLDHQQKQLDALLKQLQELQQALEKQSPKN